MKTIQSTLMQFAVSAALWVALHQEASADSAAQQPALEGEELRQGVIAWLVDASFVVSRCSELGLNEQMIRVVMYLARLDTPMLEPGGAYFGLVEEYAELARRSAEGVDVADYCTAAQQRHVRRVNPTSSGFLVDLAASDAAP